MECGSATAFNLHRLPDEKPRHSGSEEMAEAYPTVLVAGIARIRSPLDWRPQFQELSGAQLCEIDLSAEPMVVGQYMRARQGAGAPRGQLSCVEVAG